MVDITPPTSLPVAWQHGARESYLQSLVEPSPAERAEAQSLNIEQYDYNVVLTQAVTTPGSVSPEELQLANEWLAEWESGYNNLPFISICSTPN